MEIKAFKGFRYNQDVVDAAGDCVAPPYDVIDDQLRDNLYQKSPFNIVRIINGKKQGNDTDLSNVYTRAAEFLNELVDKGALKQDSHQAIYGYVQDFTINQGTYQRSGFVALGKLREFGQGIQAHERTLDGPKADRLNLMRATASQFGQIFMLYDDPEQVADSVIKQAASRPALMDFVDHQNVRHRLYAIDDPEKIHAITWMMSNKQAVIADGHHRYETALNYYKETQNPQAQYRMMTFVNMRNPGLVILPTHRLVSGVADFDLSTLLEKMGKQFNIQQYPFSDAESKQSAEMAMFKEMQMCFEKNKIAFGLYAGSNVFYTVVLNEVRVMNEALPQVSAAARILDVNVLHKLILDDMLGIGESQLASQSNLNYIKGIDDAVEKSIDKVDQGTHQAVFFMNPTKIDQVKAVAATGEKMPQKSTFFYPKIFTGLVVNKLSAELAHVEKADQYKNT